MVDDIVTRLREREAKAREAVANSKVVEAAFADQMQRFEARDGTHNTYAVRLAVDHITAARTEQKIADEYAEAASTIERLRSEQVGEPVAWQRGERELAQRWIASISAKLGAKPDYASDLMWLDRINRLLFPTPAPDAEPAEVKHADDCAWDKTRLTLQRRCTCGALDAEPAEGVTDAEAVRNIVRAMKQSFADTIAASANKLFEDTGVKMPGDHVWERYALTALRASKAPSGEGE